MIRSATATDLDPEFNKFLQAPIDEIGNGMRLSVLSELARLNLDPWHESAKLSTLPRETATRLLASLIASLPDTLSIRRNPAMVARRLITLLPNNVRSNIPLPEALPENSAKAVRKVAFIILFFIFLTSVIASQYLERTRPSISPHKEDSAQQTTASMQHFSLN